MATYRIRRGALVLGVLASLLALTGPGRANERLDGRTPPVAYYDADAVLRGSRAFSAGQARLSRLAAVYEAEAAPVRAEVDQLRGQLAQSAGWSDGARRTIETRLASRTITLLVLRGEGARALAEARAEMLVVAQQRIVATVARVAGERALAVVVRTDAGTRVLDVDAIDLTPLVIAALDAEPDAAPPDGRPGEGGRTPLQSCDAATAEPRG